MYNAVAVLGTIGQGLLPKPLTLTSASATRYSGQTVSTHYGPQFLWSKGTTGELYG